jgi:hypothetical protein
MIGMVPPIFLFVFLGAAANSIAAIIQGEVAIEEKQMVMFGLGAVFIVVVIGVIIRAAGKVLKEELKTGRSGQVEHDSGV